MSDTPKTTEHEQPTEKPSNKVADLPEKPVTEKDAQAVKGGFNYGKI